MSNAKLIDIVKQLLPENCSIKTNKGDISYTKDNINHLITFLFSCELNEAKLLDIIKTKQCEHLVVICSNVNTEAQNVAKAFKNRRNLKVNILASQTCYINNKEINIIEMFKNQGINIQKADIPFVKVMISDSKEMMHTYTKFSEDKRNVIPETAIGIWNKYEDMARNYDERFLNQLEKIKRKQKKT